MFFDLLLCFSIWGCGFCFAPVISYLLLCFPICHCDLHFRATISVSSASGMHDKVVFVVFSVVASVIWDITRGRDVEMTVMSI